MPIGCSTSSRPVQGLKLTEMLMKDAFKILLGPFLYHFCQALQGQCLGNAVDLYTHGLQTATRALRDGRDEETIAARTLSASDWYDPEEL